jgi:hypothetical protein
MKELPQITPLRLTTAGYWLQLEELIESKSIPLELADTLKALVNSQINKTIGPEAKYPVIRMASEYLKDGIILIDSAGELLYDVMVLIPNQPDDEMRTFFCLVRKWPGGQLHYLESLVSL